MNVSATWIVAWYTGFQMVCRGRVGDGEGAVMGGGESR